MTDETESLIEVARSVQNVNQTNESFRQAANDNNNNISKVLKDVYTAYSSQKNNLVGLQNSIDDVAASVSQTTQHISATNNLLAQSLQLQNSMVGILRDISQNINSIENKNKSSSGSGVGNVIDAWIASKLFRNVGAAAEGAGAAAEGGVAAEGAGTALEGAAASGASKLLLGATGIGTFVTAMLQPGNTGDWAGQEKQDLARIKGANPNTNPQAAKPFLDLVHSGESGKKNYNDYYGSGAYGNPDKDVTKMTVDEVLAFGDQLRKKTGINTSAIGRYQIEGATLRDVMGKLGIKGTDIFDESLQDKIAIYLAKRRGRNANSLRKEWTSLNNKTDAEIYKAYDQMISGGDQQTDTNTPNPASPTNIPSASDAQQTNAPSPMGGGEPSGGDSGQQTGAPSPMGGNNPQGLGQGIEGKLKQLEGEFGGLQVTSGYRSPEHNAKVGGAKNSAHMRGNAVDVKFGGGIPATLKFIEMASKAGIGGIGVYRPGSVHIDTESKRAWGPDYHAASIPQWAKQAIDSHLNGAWGKYDASAKNQGMGGEEGSGGAGMGAGGARSMAGGMGGYGASMPFGRPLMGGRLGGLLGLGASLIQNMAEMNAPSPRSSAPMISSAAVSEKVPDNVDNKAPTPAAGSSSVVSPTSQKPVQDGFNMNPNDHSLYVSWAAKVYSYYHDEMQGKIKPAH